MAIIRMNHITLLGLESERSDILKEVMKHGVVELSPVKMEDSSIGSTPNASAETAIVETQLSDVKEALAVLSKYYPVKKPMFGIRRVLAHDEYLAVMQAPKSLWETVARIKASEDGLNRLKTEENKLMNLQTSLIPWKEMTSNVAMEGTRHTRVMYGTIPATVDLAPIVEAMATAAPAVVLSEQGVDSENHYLLFSAHLQDEAEGISILKNSGWNRVQFKELDGTPIEALEQIKNRLALIETDRKAIIDTIGQDVGMRAALEVLHDGIVMERDRLLTAGKLISTQKTFVMQGWAPAEICEKLSKRLEDRFVCQLDYREPEKGESTPVAVRNNGFTEAIQPVMNMYGTPSSNEIDPNAITMPFFIIFFGLIVSDAGYGLILAIASGLALKLFQMEDSAKRFAKLVFFSGLATIFWGVMFGGFFGIAKIGDYALWFNPSAEGGTEKLMVYCLLFGVIHLYAGHVMKAANLIRRGQFLDMIFDVIFPVIMYTGFGMVVLPNVPGLDPEMAKLISGYGLNVLLVGVVLTVLTAGRHNKSIVGKALGGLPKLYDIIGFLGDVLSYMRLLALSLSGAILAGLVNGMASGGNIIFKLTGGLLILALGHGINFAMGLLGAFVHSCRLQYLEFFSKFLEGGGDPFRPLKANTQYITVMQEDESLWKKN